MASFPPIRAVAERASSQDAHCSGVISPPSILGGESTPILPLGLHLREHSLQFLFCLFDTVVPSCSALRDYITEFP